MTSCPEPELAECGDIEILVRHHRQMFEEILPGWPDQRGPGEAEQLDCSYRQKLLQQLGRNCFAWLIPGPGKQIAASAAYTLTEAVPVPGDYQCRGAHIHSVFTAPDYRRQGLAGLLIQTMLEHCRRGGIRRVTLTSSRGGEALYRKAGFKPAGAAMKIWLEPGSGQNRSSD